MQNENTMHFMWTRSKCIKCTHRLWWFSGSVSGVQGLLFLNDAQDMWSQVSKVLYVDDFSDFSTFCSNKNSLCFYYVYFFIFFFEFFFHSYLFRDQGTCVAEEHRGMGWQFGSKLPRSGSGTAVRQQKGQPLRREMEGICRICQGHFFNIKFNSFSSLIFLTFKVSSISCEGTKLFGKIPEPRGSAGPSKSIRIRGLQLLNVKKDTSKHNLRL